MYITSHLSDDGPGSQIQGMWPESSIYSYTQTSAQAKKSVLNGKVQLVFCTPESIIQNHTYRSMMLSSVYKEKLVCIAVDEAHCIKVWGAEFRPTFAEIGNLCSIIPRHVKLIALTATATSETYHVVVHQLAHCKKSVVKVTKNIWLK